MATLDEHRIRESAGVLADMASTQHLTLTQAVYWLLYVWRSAPDAFEILVRAEASQRIVARMDDHEYAAWRAWVATPPVDRPALL